MSDAERRAVARRHHPDLGGDADEFARAMARLDAAPPARTAPAHRARGTRRLFAALRRVRRELPTRLPRSWPGAKRYGHL